MFCCLLNRRTRIVRNISCFFVLKEIADARKIRNQLVSNFELANEPGISEDESRRLLHTVIVGGGPTGVEFGAELYDFVKQVRGLLCINFLKRIYLVNFRKLFESSEMTS